MFVVNRHGEKEPVAFDRITARLRSLANMSGLPTLDVDAVRVAQHTVASLKDSIHTSEIDTISAAEAAALTTRSNDYALLAGRIEVSNLHKRLAVVDFDVCAYVDAAQHILQPSVGAALVRHAAEWRDALVWQRDYEFDYFGIRTLQHTYLLRDEAGRLIETPQLMYMRVAAALYEDDIGAALKVYESLSLHVYTHATPTLCNAGTLKGQLASCFLLGVDDSVEGIFDAVKNCAVISKHCGGIGLHVSNIRATGARIGAAGGASNGLVPMLRVFDATSHYVDQGGRRPGAFAVYIEPWHADFMSFLELRKHAGEDIRRARFLFYSVWMNDLFMQRVEADAQWSFFCPTVAKGLRDAVGEGFTRLYEAYEAEGKASSTLPARDVWLRILENQIETGTPYIVFKDAANLKSNQQNLGTISSSNLCSEIIEYSDANEIAVCNLASISLPRFVTDGRFDYDALADAVREVTRNLNRVIDVSTYPLPQCRVSNMKHRPIGIGVQGLADVFLMLRHPFDSDAAKAVNKRMFQTMYHAAVSESVALAQQHGAYESFPGSPASQGRLSPHLWQLPNTRDDDGFDWDALGARVAEHGMRNSLLLAPMPTASTAQILRNTEAFEPISSVAYTRRVMSGNFTVINRHLEAALRQRGQWTDAVRDSILRGGGSVADVDVDDDIKSLYRTAYELPQRVIIDLAAQRAPYVDQSQSLNLFFKQPSFTKLNSALFHSWRCGLKTGVYYVRTETATDANAVTLKKPTAVDGVVCESCSA